MKKDTYQIRENPPGNVLNCECAVDVTADGETVGLEFPQLGTPEDNIGPMVDVCVHGAKLVVRLTGREDSEWGFAWDEKEGTWRMIERPKPVEVKP